MISTTIVGYLGKPLASIEVSPLPTRLDQIVLVAHHDIAQITRRKQPESWERVDHVVTEWCERTRRPLSWLRANDIEWLGPFAHGGELHRDLWGCKLRELLNPLRAWDPIGERWVPVDPPPPPPRRKPAPLDEDDDDNAAQPRAFVDAMPALVDSIRGVLAARNGGAS